MSLYAVSDPYKNQIKRFSTQKELMSRVSDINPVFCIREGLSGELEPIYHVSLIMLLDEVFTSNNLHLLGVERERFMRLFFNQAGKATDKIREFPKEDYYEDMDKVMIDLDKFLGSYYGENDGQYTR